MTLTCKTIKVFIGGLGKIGINGVSKLQSLRGRPKEASEMDRIKKKSEDSGKTKVFIVSPDPL